MNAEERLNRACQSANQMTKAEFRKLWLEAHNEQPVSDRILWRCFFVLVALILLAISITS